MNWYTKRAALTGIYNTTELVMLQDSSPDFQDSWTFLDNRIQDVVNMAATAKQVACSQGVKPEGPGTPFPRTRDQGPLPKDQGPGTPSQGPGTPHERSTCLLPFVLLDVTLLSAQS